MFGWRSAKCPLDTYEKTWTEWRMRWLAEQFGIERLLEAHVVLPTEEFFPDEFEGELGIARRLMEVLCRYLSINAEKIQLELCDDDQMPGAAGHYVHGEQSVIRIAKSQLADPARLIATLAHELAHELLLGGGLLSASATDHEWVTDLLPVYFGLGIFAANSTLREAYQDTGTWSSWKIGRHGYLPARMFGYAFALLTFMRGENYPPWARNFLRLDASVAFQAGLTYLQQTGDSLFHPDTIRLPLARRSIPEMVEVLRSGTPSFRLCSLWQIISEPVGDAQLVTALRECLVDRDPVISATAARTLAAVGCAADPAGADLVEALSAKHIQTRIGAAYALGELRLEPKLAVRELSRLLGHDDQTVVREAASAISKYGLTAQAAAPQLLAALKTALIDCNYWLVELLADTLTAICSDPIGFALEYFEDKDPELCDSAIAAIKERQSLAAEQVATSEEPESD